MGTERAIIVGGGVVGTMHAIEACRRGWEVLHLEVDTEPRRASVRNFGLVWVSGRAAGEELDLALRARELWDRAAQEAPGICLRPIGSITLARDGAEWDLMGEVAGTIDADRRGLRLLDASDVRKVNPSVRGDILGGLHCSKDAVVEPAHVLPALRESLGRTGRYRWLPGHHAVDVLPCPNAASGPIVVDSSGRHHQGSAAILCVGDRTNGIAGRVGTALAASPLARCRLHMIQTAPINECVTTAVADGDSMRYYPAFNLDARSRLSAPNASTTKWRMQLLLVQRESGALTIGDTHTYDEPFDFAVEEAVVRELQRRAEETLGWPIPEVERRWTGVYTLTPDEQLCHRQRLDAGVWAVTGLGGRGMTLSPAVAERTWEEIAS
jgi:FAD dependent oxidoreductase TIGR03364